MKKILAFVFCANFATSLFAQNEFKNVAFIEGEKLVYRVHYGFIDAGYAEIEIQNEDKKIGNKDVYHAVGKGYSNSTFDMFFKVRDRYETYIDKTNHSPLLFIRRVDEGGYKISQNHYFNHTQNTVSSEGKIFSVPNQVQDMLSAFYFARNIDYSAAQKGQVFEIPTFVDNEIFPMKMRYVGEETIKTTFGKIRCLKFRPLIQKGRVFKHEEDLAVYVTDDLNHIPIRAEAKILVGSIKMDLESYKNLKNPLSLVHN
ncbi:MAG: DUF3108 domain-containing protein [Bacteroidia bacterium]